MTLPQLLQRKGLVLDTNLLLLYCVGRHDPQMISKFTTRLSRYDLDDFNLLIQFTALFRKMVTTPNILTEMVNLIDKKSGRYEGVLRQITTEMPSLEEQVVSSQKVIDVYSRPFLTFGFTDLVLCELAKQSYIVLTDDSAVRAFINGNQGAVLDFNDLRALLIQKTPYRNRK